VFVSQSAVADDDDDDERRYTNSHYNNLTRYTKTRTILLFPPNKCNKDYVFF